MVALLLLLLTLCSMDAVVALVALLLLTLCSMDSMDAVVARRGRSIARKRRRRMWGLACLGRS